MRTDTVAVIMAGGAGTRFWPLSTDERPKQFLALTGERSLLQLSFDRLQGFVPSENILVLTNARYTALVAQQLPELPQQNIVGEPCRRDTAAAVALAGLLAERRFGANTKMVVLTADHVIETRQAFQDSLSEALDACGARTLYTLGIKPTYPATQFGYLQMSETVDTGRLQHYRLNHFKEKPNLETAQEFLKSGRYYWNSGMFVWDTADILAEFQEHLPAHLDKLRPVIDDPTSESFEKAFAELESISVDFAILEKARNIQAVIPDITWDDVGGWKSAAKYLSEDPHGNAVRGDSRAFESRGNTVFAEDPTEQIVLLGVDDLVVVRSQGRTLVAHKSQLDLIKQAVTEL